MTTTEIQLMEVKETKPAEALQVQQRQQLLSIMPNGQLDIVSMGRVLAQSGYFKDIKSLAQGIVKIMLGQELGLGPLMSIMKLYIVKENPVISANLMASRIRQSGIYDYEVVELGNARCSIRFLRKKENAWKAMTPEIAFTLDDAKRAHLGGLSNGAFHPESNWVKWPRNMLFARCMSDGYRFHCPDVFAMSVYTPADFEVAIDAAGEIVAQTVPPTEPADDIPDDIPIDKTENGNGGNGHTKPPTDKAGAPAPPANAISEAQAKRFYAIWKGRRAAGWNQDSINALLKDHNIPNDRAIPKSFYDALVRTIEKQTFDEYMDLKTNPQ